MSGKSHYHPFPRMKASDSRSRTLGMFFFHGPFWTKNGQTWQACQLVKVAQKGPKGTKMANLSVFDHLGPFWAHLDPYRPFQTRFDILGKIIIFVWNGPRVPKWSETLKLAILDHFGALTSLPCLATFGPKWTIFGHPQSWKVDPKVKKNGSSLRLLCVACLWNPNSSHLEHIYMVAIYEKCQK